MEDAGLVFLLDAVDRFLLREELANNLEHPDPAPLLLLSTTVANRGTALNLQTECWVWLRSTDRR